MKTVAPGPHHYHRSETHFLISHTTVPSIAMDTQYPLSDEPEPISKRLKLSTSVAGDTSSATFAVAISAATTSTDNSTTSLSTCATSAATTVTTATTAISSSSATTITAVLSSATTTTANSAAIATANSASITTNASANTTTAVAANDTTVASAATTTLAKSPTYRRRKIAIFFAYCGVGYQGMQKNPGAKTIEGDLEEALYRSGAVPEPDRGRPGKYEWARSARTDKGVSAVGQVASGRFIVDPPGFIDRLNSNLDDQIRVFGFKRVTGSFNAQKFCDRRRYVYLIPVFALDPSSHVVLGSSGSEVCLECSKSGRIFFGIMGKGCSDLNNVNDNVPAMSSSLSSSGDKCVGLSENGGGDKLEELKDGEYEGKDRGLDGNGEVVEVKEREFCYGDKERERFNRILRYYVGTHNFHNFTSRITAQDPSAKRYIVSFNADTTVIVDGIEFVKCEVVGQSFLLHQIRKMIGLAVVIMRDIAPEALIERAFRKDVKINVPVAPEVGLYLDECFFSPYNKKWKESHEEVSMKAYAEEAEAFKMKYIYPHIASTEHKDGTVALWLHYLNHRNYPDLRISTCTSEENAEPQDLLVRNDDGNSSAIKTEVGNPCIGTNGNNDFQNVEVKDMGQ